MKKISLIFCICILALLGTIACHKNKNSSKNDNETSKEVSAKADSASLNDVASISFDDNTFASSTKITISKKSTKETQDRFNDIKELYDVQEIADYEVRINTGKIKPQKDLFIEFTIPSNILEKYTTDFGIKAFGQLYYESNEESSDNFEIIQSEFNQSKKNIKISLRPYFFTNHRTTDQTYEAILKIATSKGPNYGVKKTTSSDCAGQYISCPVTSCNNIKSKFGTRIDPITKEEEAPHYGVDIEAAIGTEVKAAANGEVVRVRENQIDSRGKGYGNYVVIRHKKDNQEFSTLYAHLSEFKVKVGDQVKERDIIALSGKSGGVTGPHLHLEYYMGSDIADKDAKRDPLDFVNTTSPRLLSATARCTSVNTCEFSSTEMGSPWTVNFEYSDPTHTITSDATLTFDDGYKVFTVPAGFAGSNTTVESPTFCAHFINLDHFHCKVYMTLKNGYQSNCIYFNLDRPAGANKGTRGNSSLPGMFKI